MAGAEESIVVRLAGPPDGPWEVLAPDVGVWTPSLANGAPVAPGGDVGTLRRLNRRARLVLPPGRGGRVEHAPRSHDVAVGYGDLLFRLVRFAPGASDPAKAAAVHAADADVPAGCAAVRAPTDGVFYHRPDPASAPFVRVGDRIRSGQPVGLVEVMKTFNQIVYGDPALPAEAVVVEIRRADGQEIAVGDVLLVLRPEPD